MIGDEVTVLDNCCCGLPAETYGDRQAAQKLAAKNLRLLRGDRFDLIVTDCSSCAAFLKKYPALFPKGDPRHTTAQAVSARVRDLVELAGDLESRTAKDSSGTSTVPPSAFRDPRSERLIVTYHDPCHASRGQKLVAEPRRLLQALPGVEYRELPEADWCCGGAGSYALSHYDLARAVLDRKIGNVEKTGANLLVTSCPACIVHLSYGVRLRKLPVRVCHIAELMADVAVSR
jgi:glycolate oxidase iron-sulfur subunit